MQSLRIFSKIAAVLAAAILAVALASCSAPSGDSGWAGTYKTQDTQGNAMEVVLEENGSATGTRQDEHLDGSWKADDDTSVTITWDETWSTKIAKDGDTYTKTAYKDGTQDGDPVSAEKVK
jgi:hypothetical protein